MTDSSEARSRERQEMQRQPVRDAHRRALPYVCWKSQALAAIP